MDVSELAVGAQRYQSDEENAGILIDTLFPTPPTPETSGCDEVNASGQNQTPEWPQLTKHEVRRAIFSSSSDKVPGPDEISFRV
jgi:hypothetical protein